MANARALIFDMDGVIVDSNPLHRESWVAFNRQHGLETTDAMHQFMYGKRNDEIVRQFFGADLTEEEVTARGAAKEAIYRQMMRPRLKEMLVPGVREFLARHQDLPIGVATNAEPENVAFVLEGAGLAHLFRAVVDGHQVSKPKPHPDIYLKAASLLGVDPLDCVVFEDSYSGIAAAKAAGMRTVGLRTTHAVLPDVELAIDNFRDTRLDPWLANGGA